MAIKADESLDELTHQHFAPRAFRGAIAIEVHHTLEAFSESEDLWPRARPVEPGSPLHLLSAPDHLWHLLWHAVVHHPFRRGNLRDLLLTARAVEACASEDRSEVRERIHRHEFARSLFAQLEMAEGLLTRERGDGGSERTPGASGHPTSSERAGERRIDHFRREAAANYLVVSLYGSSGWPAYFQSDVTAAVFVLVGDRVDRRAFWRRMLGTPVGESAAGWLRALEARLPILGRELRRVLRIPRALGAFALALPVAAGARWLGRGSPRGR